MGYAKYILFFIFAFGLFQLAEVTGATEQSRDTAAVSKTSPPPSTYVLCKNKKMVRSIRVTRDASQKECVAFYTKSGIDKEVGRGLNSNSCKKIAENIKTNLVSSNWQCRDISSVDILSTQNEK
ncbi:MAG: hypothetical protein ABL927_01040 [Bdellovibrionales bacterium]